MWQICAQTAEHKSKDAVIFSKALLKLH